MYTATNRDPEALGRTLPFRPVGGAECAPDATADLVRGQYLCEFCQDRMTDDTLPVPQSPTGVEMAICSPCRVRQRS